MNKWNTLIFAVSAIFTVASIAVAVYLTMQDQGDCIQVGSATTEKREWRIL